VLHQHHPSEGARAQGFQPIEVIQAWIVL
jgi:hypothetical protein